MKNARYAAGEFDYASRTPWINRAIGHLQQVRFNVRPEVIEFTMSDRLVLNAAILPPQAYLPCAS